MNFQVFPMEQTTLTLTQLALGAELLWEPKVGTPEHDRCVDAYIPGAGTLQQKRATICIDFFNTVEATTMPYPFTRTYHISVPARRSPVSFAPHDSFSTTASSPASTTKPTGSKRAHDGASAPSKRLPGFSIMTRDGVDITENQSRGPKTKEQREHAAKMRKLGACPSCKKRKQKCEPSHHRPSGAPLSVAATPMGSSMSARSSIPSLSAAPSPGSRASISPQTSLESAFTPSPLSASIMPTAAISKQPQLWEDGLLSFDALDDEFMLNTGAYDNLAFGQNMFGQHASASNWDFAAPPMGDFDLFSYDNTLDFDASLYVNTPSPLLQSSSLSPTSLQQPPQAFSKQPLDTAQQPFAYDANGQFLGNVEGTTSEYGFAVDSRHSAELDGLEPDRPTAAARQPVQEVAYSLGQGLQSSMLSGKQQTSVPQSDVDHKTIDPRTDLLLESIASSPESSVLSSILNSPHAHVQVQTRGPTWGSDVSPSQSSSLGSPVGLQDVQDTASGLLTPPGSQRSPVSETSESSFGHSTAAPVHRHSGRLENADRTALSPGSGQPSLSPTSTVASYLDSFEDSSMSPTAPVAPVWASIHDSIDNGMAVNTSDFQRRRPSAIQRDDRLNTDVAFSSESASPSSSAPAVAVFNIAQTIQQSALAKSSSSTTTPKTARKTRSSVPAIRKLSPHELSSDNVSCPTPATTPYNSSTVQDAARVTQTDAQVSASAGRTRVAVKVDRETLTAHTAAKTHSLYTSTYQSTDTPKIEGVTQVVRASATVATMATTLATVQKLAGTYGLVTSVVSTVDVSVGDATQKKATVSYLDKLSNIVLSVLMQFSHGFKVGYSSAEVDKKSIGRGPRKDLGVMMGGLRLC